MRNLFLVLLLLLLSGCDHFIEADPNVEPDAVHVEKEAVHVEREAVHVEKGAVTAEPGTVTASIQSGAVKVNKVLEVHTVKDTAHIEPINFNKALVENPSLTLAPKVDIAAGAVQLVLPEGAIKVTLTIAEGALKLDAHDLIQTGAVQMRGAEIQKGAIEVSPWLLGLLIFVLSAFGFLWLFTRHRRRTETAKLRSKEIGQHEPETLLEFFS